MEVWSARGCLVVVLAVIAAVSCGRAGAPDAAWASEVDGVVAELTDVYDAGDVYRAAAFYTAGGTLDLDNWGLGVAKTPDEVVRMVERVWYFQPGRANVAAEHVFVTPDGALVWWFAYEFDGFSAHLQSYAFSGNRVSSRVFQAIDVVWEDPTAQDEWLLDVVDRYLRVWDGTRSAAPETVYAADAELRDDMVELVVDGVEAIAAEIAASPPVERGPGFPAWRYFTQDRIEAVVLVEVDDECPRLEARRLVFVDGLIAYELRYTHVPSVRRCGRELSGGWWTTFEVPGDLMDNVTEVVDAAGRAVALVNAEPAHEEFVRWLLEQFTAGGLRPPRAARLWFPPHPDCVGQEGLATDVAADQGGEHTIVLCYPHDRLRSDTSESGWRTPPIRTGLHELAHLWMWEHLDEATEAAFVERAGLPVWRDDGLPAGERGIELAADTIAWGLAGTTDARYPKQPVPGCEELAARYELLTGRPPVTSCDEGWSG